MVIKVGRDKREIGLGLCLVLLVGSGVLSHYLFRLFALPHSVDVFGFALSLVAAFAVVIGFSAVYLLVKPAKQ
jgi:hypothetical protein